MDGDLANRTQATDLTRNLATQASAVSYRRPARRRARAGPAMRARLLRRRARRRRRPARRDPARRADRSRRQSAGEPDRPFGGVCRRCRPRWSTARSGTRSITTTSTWRCRVIRRSRSCRACSPSPSNAQSSGRDVIAAFVAGYETACRIGSAHASGPLRSRLSRDRHGRLFRRRRGLRPAARPRRRGHRARARHRRHAGGRAQVAIRHDVQAVPRRQGVAERPAGGAARGARLFEPARHGRMRAGFCPDARPRFPPGDGARRPAAAGSTSSPTCSSTTPPAT